MKLWDALRALDEGELVEFKPKFSGWDVADAASSPSRIRCVRLREVIE